MRLRHCIVNLAALSGALLIAACLQAQTKAPGAPSSAGIQQSPQNSAAVGSGGPSISIKRQIAGDFTYRFISDDDQMAAPTPLPAGPTPDAAVFIPIPTAIASHHPKIEIVDKARGTVAQIPVAAGQQIPLTETSFQLAHTVYVSVQHEGKAVTDAFVTIADGSHKYSMAWQLKATDNGVAQFSNAPLGAPLTVAVNYTGHPSISQTTTLLAGAAKDGFHWPTINVDWPDVPTIAPQAPAAAPAAATDHRAVDDKQAASTGDRKKENGGGFFSSLLNEVFALAVIAAIVYGFIWAFNKGHIKTLLDRAGINTAELSSGTQQQPDPFAKPAREPLTPITEGTADPFGGGAVIAAAPIASAAPAGPRLIGSAGSYSGSIFPISAGVADVGRDASCAVPLPNDTNCSRRHATLSIAGGAYTITDNGSSNGTFLNGVKIPSGAAQPVRAGDEIQIGGTRFRFEVS